MSRKQNWELLTKFPVDVWLKQTYRWEPERGPGATASDPASEAE